MKPRSNETPTDSPEYLEAWAQDLVAAIGDVEARKILDDYQALADNPKLSKHGREIAANRAKVLKRFV